MPPASARARKVATQPWNGVRDDCACAAPGMLSAAAAPAAAVSTSRRECLLAAMRGPESTGRHRTTLAAVSASPVFGPSSGAQAARVAGTAPKTPIVLVGAIARVAGMRLGADERDE